MPDEPVTTPPAAPGVAVLDAGGRIVLWNLAAESLTGWSAEAVQGRPFPAVGEDPDTAWRVFLANLDATAPAGFAASLRTSGGDVLPLHIWASPTPGSEWRSLVMVPAGGWAPLASERLRRLHEITRDLGTARSVNDAAAIVIERGLSALGAGAGSVSLLSDDGTEVHVIRAYGYPEAMLREWARFPLSASTPISDAIRSVQPVWLESRSAWRARYPHLSDAAESSPYAFAAAVPLEVNGRAFGALALSYAGSSAGISEAEKAFVLTLAGQCAQAIDRIEAAAEQDRLAQQRQLALDAARLGWWHYDPATKVAKWDERYRKIFGVTGYERPNEEILARIDPADLPSVWASVEAALDPANPRPYSSEFRIRRGDGDVRWIEAHGLAAFEGEGALRRAVSFVGTVEDVTDRKHAEEALRQSATLLMAISDSTGDVVFAKDREGRFTFANPATLSLIGKASEEVIGRTDADVLEDTAAARAVMENDQRVMASGVAEDLEEMVPLPNGERRVWFSRKTPYRDAEGNVIGLLGVSRDVTERRLADEALRLSEEKFNKAFAANPAAIALTRVEDGRFVEVNDTWMAVMGYERKDVIGRCSRDLDIWPEAADRERFVDELRRTGRVQGWEQSFRRASGEPFVGFLSAEVLDVDGMQMVLSTFLDITDRKRADEALRESEERFRALADNMSQLAWMASPAGKLLWFNKRWYDYTGFTPDGLPDFDRDAVHHPDHSDRVARRWRQSLESGEPWEDTFPLRSADGQYRWFLSRAVPLRDEDGTIVRWFGTNTDIEGQRRMEEALRQQAEQLAAADRAKDDFLAMLAHELRNPLGAIGNAAALIEMHIDGQTALRKPVDILNRQVRHTARLVDDLLDVSRITRGKLELRLEPVDLTEVAHRAVEVARPRMDAHRHAFTVALPPGPLAMEGDAARLEQVIGNLLSNSIRYTEQGGHVSLSLTAEGAEATIRVTDNGQGISPEVLPRVFDLFVQEDRSLARSKGGLGIGLTLTKKLVDMHRGTIEATSDGPGLGSQFVVRLPLSAPAGGPRREEAGTPHPARAQRVLLVEDNVDTAAGLADILSAWGHEVVAVHDGLAALEAAHRHAPNVVLLDIGLPGMDGYAVARALRSAAATAESVLIALTGYGQDSDHQRSREAGFNRHLVKPVDLASLRRILSIDVGTP